MKKSHVKNRLPIHIPSNPRSAYVRSIQTLGSLPPPAHQCSSEIADINFFSSQAVILCSFI